MCHACGERRSANDVCATCGGHRLTPLGIGIDRVVEEVKSKFPGIDVFKIDADTTKTEGQISEVMEKFRAKPGSVLVGTEAALNHLSGTVDHAAVVSLDSLFALPDFRMQERLMYTLIRLRAAATRSFLVQTRRAEEKIFEYGLKGNLSDFYHSVLAERKRFDYPPFSTLIKITLEGKKDVISKQMGELQAFLTPHEIDVFPAFTSTVRGAYIIHGLIKIPPKNWPEPELMRKLRSMPPNVYIKINPESLL
jgi:primosomal protein N' (replication factor Y)